MRKFIYLALLPILILNCKAKDEKTLSGLLKSDFQKEMEGKKTDLFILINDNGLEICVTNYGARIVSIMTPDKSGKFADIVFGFETLDKYINLPESFFGAAIGRYGNRIGKATFSIDSITYHLSPNNNGNTLHGGPNGFHKKVWDAKVIDKQTVEFNLVSKDGDEGYPGTLNVKLIYQLTNNNELKISYEATTDKKTIVNLTNHSYFNLAGDGNPTINNHILSIFADSITPVDAGLIPTGQFMAVENSPFDFRKPTVIGSRIDTIANEQLKFGKGYDHNWVLSKKLNEVGLAAIVKEPESGRVMEVLTNEPGLQFYGGNFLNNNQGKFQRVYPFRSGFCLETQHFPDSPNKPQWPSTILDPGKVYKSTCIYKFSVEK